MGFPAPDYNCEWYTHIAYVCWLPQAAKRENLIKIAEILNTVVNDYWTQIQLLSDSLLEYDPISRDQTMKIIERCICAPC